MVLLPFSGCIDNPADGAEGAAECSTSTDELFRLDIGMPDEEGILAPLFQPTMLTATIVITKMTTITTS